MYNHILIPLDGSSLAETVLPHAMALARAGVQHITLIRILDPLSMVTRPLSVDPLDWQIRKSEAEIYLRGLAGRLSTDGLIIDIEVREGRAAESVIEFAQAQDVDLILLSSHGQSGISGWNVSSVVQKIILRVKKSVMIIRAYQPIPEESLTFSYQRILLPLDGSQRAESVLPVASAFSRLLGGRLILAHVVKQPELPRRTPLSQEDRDLVDRLTERNRVEADRYLLDLQSRLNLDVETRLLVSENVSDALHQLVEQEKADLVIMSAHGYSGSNRWPYGSTVVSFIAYGTTPLLIVQDLPANRLQPTYVETVAQEQGGR